MCVSVCLCLVSEQRSQRGRWCHPLTVVSLSVCVGGWGGGSLIITVCFLRSPLSHTKQGDAHTRTKNLSSFKQRLVGYLLWKKCFTRINGQYFWMWYGNVTCLSFWASIACQVRSSVVFVVCEPGYSRVCVCVCACTLAQQARQMMYIMSSLHTGENSTECVIKHKPRLTSQHSCKVSWSMLLPYLTHTHTHTRTHIQFRDQGTQVLCGENIQWCW